MKKRLSLLLVAMLVTSGLVGIFTVLPQQNKASGLADTPWPMYRGGQKHTGRSPYDTSESVGVERWNYRAWNDVRSSPAVGSDGTVYFGGVDLHAVNPDGSRRWRFKTFANVDSSPAIGDDGTIYAGSSDSYLYAVDSQGNEEWTFETGDEILSSPVIGDDGTIYFGSLDDNLYAVDSNGTERWDFTTGSGIMSSPAIADDGTVYVASNDGRLYAVHPNGTERWSYNIGSSLFNSPVIGDDGTIYIGGDELHALDPDGSIRWKYGEKMDNRIYTSPAIGDEGDLYLGYRVGRLSRSEGKIVSLDDDGKKVWSTDIESAVSTPPTIGGEGTIYAGSSDYHLYSLYPDGGIKWSFETDDRVRSSPAIGKDGTIYFGSDDNRLYAISDEPASVPSAPLELEAEAGDGYVNLSWRPPSDDGGIDIQEYQIYRGQSSGYISYYDSVDGDIHSYTDGSVENGETYHYQVSALNSEGEGNRTEDVNATPESPPDTVPPDADAGENMTVGVDEEFTLDGGGSSDNVGIVSYEWYLDDGETMTGQEIYYRYGDVGEYEVELTVTDEANNSYTDIVVVIVEDRTKPDASAAADIEGEIKTGDEITFTASGSSDNIGIVEYEWSFDDGEKASGEDVTHTFDEKGDHEVTLTVKDESGNTDTDTIKLTVEKKDDGETPGFTLMILILGMTLVTLNKYLDEKSKR